MSFQLGVILAGAIIVIVAIGMAVFLIWVRNCDKEVGHR
jgi:hypothetical protein